MVRQHLRRTILATLTASSIVLVSVWLQFGERAASETQFHAGATETVDRIDLVASVQKIDPTGREFVLRVLVIPRGNFTDDDGVSANQSLTVYTSESVRGDLTFAAHARISTVDVPVALDDGSILDYPFDSYPAQVDFTADLGGRTVPVAMMLTSRDALFAAEIKPADTRASFDLNFVRSNSVLLYALFMIAAMWALALAVLIAARFLVTRRKGLIWPAMGWMAATLFALVAFRGAAPGSPPIGSLLDYLAFFWAEAIVACCLVITVVAGVRAEVSQDGGTPTAKVPVA